MLVVHITTELIPECLIELAIQVIVQPVAQLRSPDSRIRPKGFDLSRYISACTASRD
jgi:hypothetical protein